MNERILELAEQCYEKHELLGTYEFNKEKFAKLIVRECAAYISVLDAEPVSHKSAARMLMNHFGVKE